MSRFLWFPVYFFSHAVLTKTHLFGNYENSYSKYNSQSNVFQTSTFNIFMESHISCKHCMQSVSPSVSYAGGQC